MIKLYHRKNEIAIDLGGVQNVAAIDIYYTGKMYGESQLPSDWQLVSNRNRILCISLGNSVPELLLNYVGLINIKGGTVIDRDLNIHPSAIVIEDIDYWENFGDHFDKDTQYWEALGSTHIRNSSIKYSSIIKKNLLSNPDEFYFQDGTPYTGEYHQHSDGQAMTGSEHTDGSMSIYRKDAKGKIFNPRKKANKRQVMEIMKQVKPTVPMTRKITKSDIQKIKESKKIYGSDKTTRVKTELDRTSGTGGASGGGYTGGGSE